MTRLPKKTRTTITLIPTTLKPSLTLPEGTLERQADISSIKIGRVALPRNLCGPDQYHYVLQGTPRAVLHAAYIGETDASGVIEGA